MLFVLAVRVQIPCKLFCGTVHIQHKWICVQSRTVWEYIAILCYPCRCCCCWRCCFNWLAGWSDGRVVGWLGLLSCMHACFAYLLVYRTWCCSVVLCSVVLCPPSVCLRNTHDSHEQHAGCCMCIQRIYTSRASREMKIIVSSASLT